MGISNLTTECMKGSLWLTPFRIAAKIIHICTWHKLEMYFTEEAICFSDSFIRDIKLGNPLQSSSLLISTCFTPIMIPENGYCSSFKAEETQVHRRMKLIFSTHMNSVTLRSRYGTRCESASKSKAFPPCTQCCSVDIGLAFPLVHSWSPVGFFIKTTNSTSMFASRIRMTPPRHGFLELIPFTCHMTNKQLRGDRFPALLCLGTTCHR